eukprot:CAMPEP_0204901172 /NCGR_PEP_ID=MMETSP1397-20131031/2919_1 /ASSEMBLY_ACC=CAM_ASM_000891 /TAXON_ID=49980 /ORGANISM="Climacostomum Climacostomum virens, Strain Stock W-24" /LENGTH=244 /DNA_ID=CAMNT_0052069477 /DNA_START=70 /DNA_END=804 /DNA_ORIENTATION=+
MTPKFFNEMRDLFAQLQADSEVRVIVICAEGRAFTAGLDLTTPETFFSREETDIGRRAAKFYDLAKQTQDSFNVLEAIDKPVIAVVHGICLGGGVDLVAACDIRYASADARISIREIDLVIAADLGNLQRVPKICGNDSWVRELVYTGRWAESQECLQRGFFNRVLESREAALEEAMKTAQSIAGKSPLAILGSKRTLNYSRDRSVEEGLNYVKVLNGALSQSEDLKIAVMAMLSKEKPVFPKL